MIRFYRTVLLIILCCLLPDSKGVASENICFQCHDKKNYEKEYVHEPLKNGKCTDCHNPHVAKYPALLSKIEKEFCAGCHMKYLTGLTDNFAHQPVQEGKCLVCHDPHVSKLKGLIKSETIAAICFKCHETVAKQYQHMHKPFADGQCNKCHRPHQSKNGQLLSAEPDVLCVSCHSLAALANKHNNYPGELKWCLSCHQPHGSDRKALIRNNLHEPYSTGCNECHGTGKEGVQNCLRCHIAVAKKVNSTHNHLASKKGNSCVSCHSPHAGDGKFFLLNNRQENICKQCHLETFTAAKDKLFKHVESNICTNCHEVHGSNEPALLKGDGIGVCVNCHKTQGQFSHPVGEKVRDNRNEQQMTCVTCHHPHGTDYKYELKLSGVKDLCVQCHRSY